VTTVTSPTRQTRGNKTEVMRRRRRQQKRSRRKVTGARWGRGGGRYDSWCHSAIRVRTFDRVTELVRARLRNSARKLNKFEHRFLCIIIWWCLFVLNAWTLQVQLLFVVISYSPIVRRSTGSNIICAWLYNFMGFLLHCESRKASD